MQINPSLAGRHLIIDLVTNDIDLLNNTSHAEEFSYKVTEITGMQLVIPVITMKFPFNSELHQFTKKLKNEGTTSPVIKQYTDYVERKERDDTGVSSLGLWNTSHLSTHSWTECSYISIDLYSCLDFEIEPVLEFTRQHYKPNRMDILSIRRFVGAPQETEQFTWIKENVDIDVNDFSNWVHD